MTDAPAPAPACQCGKPFPPKRVPKSGMCRNCWSLKGVKRKLGGRAC